MGGMRRIALTFAISAAGVAVFELLGLPLPFLLGPLAACLVAALAQIPMREAGPISAAMRTVLGVAVGASITPALLERLPDMALSAALIPPFVLLIGLIGYPFFRRVIGFDHATAYYAAMPGGFQDMVLFGQEAGGDVR
ncbi:MAG: AbrB family transcriptional regulator, partial [Pseudomonadota bacterium]